MTEHEKILFSILKSALWGAPVEIPEGFSQWSAILKLAKTQTLTGLVGDVMLTRSEIRESLPPSIVAKLQSIPLTYIGMHRQMNAALQVLVQTLRQNDIDQFLLKGQGLAKYYPIPELRQCGDIDIYVGEENYEKAYDALVQIVSSIDDKSNIWDLMHFHASVGSVIIEVHHRADKMYSRKKENIYKKYMIAGLSQGCSSIRCGDVDVMTPEDTYNALYIFVHIWRHFSASGVGLRQFCDWACFLHSNSDRLDLPYLRGMLQELGLLKPWQVFGCFLVKSLGLPKNEFPFYSSKYVDELIPSSSKCM